MVFTPSAIGGISDTQVAVLNGESGIVDTHAVRLIGFPPENNYQAHMDGTVTEDTHVASLDGGVTAGQSSFRPYIRNSIRIESEEHSISGELGAGAVSFSTVQASTNRVFIRFSMTCFVNGATNSRVDLRIRRRVGSSWGDVLFSRRYDGRSRFVRGFYSGADFNINQSVSLSDIPVGTTGIQLTYQATGGPNGGIFFDPDEGVIISAGLVQFNTSSYVANLGGTVTPDTHSPALAGEFTDTHHAVLAGDPPIDTHRAILFNEPFIFARPAVGGRR